MSAADRFRYERATHCMQAAVKMDQVKHAETGVNARVGINVALRDHASLVRLLVSKGIITLDEYESAIADGMDEEVKMLEKRLGEEIGRGMTEIKCVGALGSIHDAIPSTVKEPAKS